MQFKSSHLVRLNVQKAQSVISIDFRKHGDELEKHFSYSALCGDVVLACAGILPLWPGRAQVWAWLSGDILPSQMSAIHKAAARGIKSYPVKRLEATCAVEFKAAHRWLQMLGFQCETPVMRGYHPDGSDEAMYVRIE